MSSEVDGDRGDLAEFGKKNATQVMILLPHYMWAENNKVLEVFKFCFGHYYFERYSLQRSRKLYQT